MKPLLDLAKYDCRWPMTDDKPFLFCGEPQAGESSYCACHKAMSVSPAQPVPLRGMALTRLANAFGGGRARALNKAGVERGREAVDTAMAMTLSTTRLKQTTPTFTLSRTAPRRAAE